MEPCIPQPLGCSTAASPSSEADPLTRCEKTWEAKGVTPPGKLLCNRDREGKLMPQPAVARLYLAAREVYSRKNASLW